MNIKVIAVSCFLLSTSVAFLKFLIENGDAQARDKTKFTIGGSVALILALIMVYVGIKSLQ